MPIFILEGPPRSGKSYSAVVEHIIPALKAGRAVVTDIPLNVAELNRLTRRDCEDLVFVLQQRYLGRRPFSQIADLWPEWQRELPGGGIERPLIVVDEAHEVFPAGKQGAMTEEMAQWFAMHGHHGFDIVVISQDHMLLALDIRRRVEMRWKFKKLTALGSKMGYAQLVFEGQAKQPMAKGAKRYKRRYFPAYKSFTGGGAPSQAKVRPVWLGPKFIVLAGGLLATALYVVGSGGPTTSFGGGSAAGGRVVGVEPATMESTGAAAPSPSPEVSSQLRALADALAVVQAQNALERASLEQELLGRSRCGYGGVRPKEKPALFEGGGEDDDARGECVLEPRPAPPPRHLLAGARVSIGGVISVAGASPPAVYLKIVRDGRYFGLRTSQLRASGWRFRLVGPCALEVSGPWSGLIDCYGVDVPA